MVIVAGLLIAVLPRGNDGDNVGGDTPPTNPTPADSSAPQALPTAVPTTAPAGVRWELVGPLAVPVSATAGPKRATGTTASGFAHTPEGALIAAAQIGMRSSYSLGRNYWEPTIEQQFVPSADRDRMLATLRATDAGPSEPGTLSQIAGFSYQSYTPDTAVIGLVLRAPSAGTPRVSRGRPTPRRPPPARCRRLVWVLRDLTGTVDDGHVQDHL
ncbi:hypothetical protein [Micromonospora sp. KC606]|uniref:hypothetical protein n=1 Tax=Micromonospora sp. KC606 TaxID=2530379 RepID=UPI001FB84AE7|nr:hypothetical protein [Micromonospora sp. KC606]